MATKYYYLSGVSKWAKLRKPDEKYQNWTINLYLNQDSEEVYEESGMAMAKHTDEEGTYVTFRRPLSKVIKGELVKFDPPKVFNKDNEEIEVLIGNGSEVTVKVAVYDTIKGKGHRLESVRVEKLVEYNAPVGLGVDADNRPALPF